MEEIAINITMTISHAVEILATLVIGLGIIRMMIGFSGISKVPGKVKSKVSIRIDFGSTIAVALELLLAADVLATAVSPGWDEIGKLATIAVLRTGLNYFLEKELENLDRNGSVKTVKE